MSLHDDAPNALDEEGLLCALVLAPSTYSRNRFFGLFQNPNMGRVRRRAKLVRSLVRQMSREDKTHSVKITEQGVQIELSIPSLGYRRHALLSPVEHDLVVYLLSRGAGVVGACADAQADAARVRVEQAIVRLSGLPLA